MKEYKRTYPKFSLCGLNCGLCPRYQTGGVSKCPGCGGKDFHLKHPSCAVITCSKKHGDVEYCFLCGSFPCGRFKSQIVKDSFITYRNVLNDMQKAALIGVGEYQKELDEKVEFLEYLILNFNDGRKKNFYCLAVNLLSREDLKDIRAFIDENFDDSISFSQKVEMLGSIFYEKAKSGNIELKLRK